MAITQEPRSPLPADLPQGPSPRRPKRRSHFIDALLVLTFVAIVGSLAYARIANNSSHATNTIVANSPAIPAVSAPPAAPATTPAAQVDAYVPPTSCHRSAEPTMILTAQQLIDGYRAAVHLNSLGCLHQIARAGMDDNLVLSNGDPFGTSKVHVTNVVASSDGATSVTWMIYYTLGSDSGTVYHDAATMDTNTPWNPDIPLTAGTIFYQVPLFRPGPYNQ